MRRLTGVALITVAVIATALLLRHPDATPADSTPAPTPLVTGPAAASPTPADGSPPATTPTGPTPVTASASPPSGRALAERWLRGYLTRTDRDDTSWVATVAPLTAPELLTKLQAAGPGAIGAARLRTWRVAAIAPYAGVDTPVDTPSRMVLTYSVTLTDGQHTVTKPFELLTYRSADGRWLVTGATQRYSSEG